MRPFLAMITPLVSGDAHPEHPIAPGGPGQPPGYWGGVAPPWVDNTLPGQPPASGQPPGYWGGVAPPLPTHPIAPGGPPPGYWGGVAPPLPTHPIAPGGAPPKPTHPIVIPPDAVAPGVPSHPIYWPIAPDNTLPGAPPTPTHPIVIPGDDPANPKFEVKTAWTPESGWIVVIVPTDDAIVPTPSA